MALQTAEDFYKLLGKYHLKDLSSMDTLCIWHSIIDVSGILLSLGDHHKQKVIVSLFAKLLEIRKTMVEDIQLNTSDPSISAEMLKTIYNLQPFIDNLSSGI